MKPTLCVYCDAEPVFCTYAIGLVAIPVCARKRCTATFDADSAAVHLTLREGRVDADAIVGWCATLRGFDAGPRHAREALTINEV